MGSPALGIVLWGLAVFTLLGLVFGFALAAAAAKFQVPVNPLVERVRDRLPAANCGACGFAGCQAYAEAVVERGDVSPNLCLPGRAAVAGAVAELTGKQPGSVVDRVVVLRCHGTSAFAPDEARYAGIRTCAAASFVFGGPKACKNGCLGLGDCVDACPFGALAMTADGHPRGGPREVHRLRHLRDRVPQGPVELRPARPPRRAVVRGGRQAQRGARHLHGGLHAVPPVRGEVPRRGDHLGRPDHRRRPREVHGLRARPARRSASTSARASSCTAWGSSRSRRRPSRRLKLCLKTRSPDPPSTGSPVSARAAAARDPVALTGSGAGSTMPSSRRARRCGSAPGRSRMARLLRARAGGGGGGRVAHRRVGHERLVLETCRPRMPSPPGRAGAGGMRRATRPALGLQCGPHGGHLTSEAVMHKARAFFVVCAGLLGLALLLPRPAAAAWPTDPLVNVPLCTATGDQDYPTSVSDGAGGAIVTWQDARSGNCDIYAQRISADGTVQWTANGVALCTATGDQCVPHHRLGRRGRGHRHLVRLPQRQPTTSTPSGSRPVARSSGRPTAWPSAPPPAISTYPTIVSDGAGGAIVTWQDYRSGNYDIYAQRISAGGAVQWTANGVALCTAAGSQYYPTIVSDGAGGAIVTWYDDRSGTTTTSTPSGSRPLARSSGRPTAWPSAPPPAISTTPPSSRTARAGPSSPGRTTAAATTTSTPSGSRPPARSSGRPTAWPSAPPPAISTYPTIVSDGAGGAIVTWQDCRSGTDCDIYAQRISAAGAVQWTANGVALCTATGDQDDPTIVSDGAGGAIVTWEDYRSGTTATSTPSGSRPVARSSGRPTAWPSAPPPAISGTRPSSRTARAGPSSPGRTSRSGALPTSTPSGSGPTARTPVLLSFVSADVDCGRHQARLVRGRE